MTGVAPRLAASRCPIRSRARPPASCWTLLSVGLFAGIWEAALVLSAIADPKLLPPPHVFLGNFPEQTKFFNTAQRWQIGVGLNTGPIARDGAADHRAAPRRRACSPAC